MINLKSKYWKTYNLRALIDYKIANEVEPKWMKSAKREVAEIAIILQGPICHRKNFTTKIVRHYLATIESATIIVSTWKSEDVNVLERIKEDFGERVQIIQSEIPENPGRYNMNLQITSTVAGLRLARDLGFNFAMKSRTDQGFLDLNFFRTLLNVYNQYSFNEKSKANRLVICSFNTFLFRLYGVSDMFQAGKLSELLDFWDVPLDLETSVPSLQSISMRDYARLRSAELFVATKYFEKRGHELNFLLSQSLELIKDYFIVLDAKSLGFVWNKYTFQEERWNSQRFPHKFYEITFIDWLLFDSKLEHYISYEKLLDTSMLEEGSN